MLLLAVGFGQLTFYASEGTLRFDAPLLKLAMAFWAGVEVVFLEKLFRLRRRLKRFRFKLAPIGLERRIIFQFARSKVVVD